MLEQSLSNKQYSILKFMFTFTIDIGHTPTIRQICDHFKYASPRAAHRHVVALKNIGYLTTSMRGIDLNLDRCWELFGLPVLGKVPAGTASLQEILNLSTLKPSDWFPRGEGYYALEVTGDSMQDAGIREGDIVILDETIEPQPNDIVVASPRDDEEFTLKQLIKNDNELFLKPANKSYKTIKLNGGRILAVVIGVHRIYRHPRA
jgi:repressor LexA